MKIEFKDGEVIARATSVDDVRILLALDIEKHTTKDWTCTICGQVCTTYRGLQIHTSKIHGLNNKEHKVKINVIK